MSRHGRAEHGFTLIELLVAVLIFSLLSLAGVVVLRGSVTAQSAVTARLDELGDVQRGIATLDADLAQAVVRITRTQSGALAPAFFGRAAQGELPILQFVRAGWSNPGDAPRPAIQKVEYWWRGGRIERIGYAVPDGGAPGPAGTLFEGVSAARLRYRNGQGEWLEQWAPANPRALPVLIELALTRGSRAPLILRFVVGVGASSPPDAAPSATDMPPPAGRPRTDPAAIRG